MKKTLLGLLVFCITCPAAAETWNEQELRANSAAAAMRRACPPKNQETWKDQEKRAQCEENFKLRYYDSSQSKPVSTQQQGGSSIKDPGPCMGYCASEQGICISNCGNNDRCIGNCGATHGRCVSQCY